MPRIKSIPEIEALVRFGFLSSLLAWSPGFKLGLILYVVDRIVAASRDAGHFIAGELIPNFGVHRIALKRASARVTVQAFAIVVGLVELNVFGPWWRAEILDINVAQGPRARRESRHRGRSRCDRCSRLRREKRGGSENERRICKTDRPRTGFFRMAP